MTSRILIVEDEFQLQRVVRELLEKEGYLVRAASSAEDALVELRKSVPDLLILDVRLPGMNGFELCKKLKESGEWRAIPVIFLTTKTEEANKVLGFELGADDYVAKPFGPLELLARVKTAIRRTRGADEREVLKAGSLTVNVPEHTVQAGGRALDLPPKEFHLLCLFLRKRGRVLSRAFIMESVWGQDYLETSRTVDTHIRRLRDHLGKLGDGVKTVEGFGYKWEDPER